MPTVALYNIEGKEIGKVELSEQLFGIEPNTHVMHLVVKAHLANMRQGTQSAKTRAEVSGGGIKPWKQKGTGRARQGSTRSPQWTHGGVVFAPKPRDYHMDVNKKVRRLALRSALSTKAAEGEIIVYDELNIAAPKKKEMVKVLAAKDVRNALIVLPEREEVVARASANIPNVETTLAETLSVYDILKHRNLIMTKASLAKVEEVFGK